MEVTIKPDLEQFIRDKVRAGQYPDANALINDAVAVLMQREEELRQEIAKGLESLRREGPAEFDLEKFLAERRREYNEKQKGLVHGGPR
jgi:putative addiction module CopG family antidote